MKFAPTVNVGLAEGDPGEFGTLHHGSNMAFLAGEVALVPRWYIVVALLACWSGVNSPLALLFMSVLDRPLQ
jgi:hypothetical protein